MARRSDPGNPQRRGAPADGSHRHDDTRPVPPLGTRGERRTEEAVIRADTLTLINNLMGKSHEVPINTAPFGPRISSRSGRDRKIVDSSSTIHLREHGLVEERQHVYRRRPGHPRVSRLPDRAARRRHLVAPRAAVLGDVDRLWLPNRLYLNLLLAEACDCLVLCLHRAIPDRPASVPWAVCSMSHYGGEHRGRLIACLPSERSGSS